MIPSGASSVVSRKFEDSSVVFMNACWSGQPNHAATAKFVKAFNDAGAGVYLSWTNLADWGTAFLSPPWFVDRMVGANLHFDKESPPQRAFPYDLVLQDMARNGLDHSLQTPAKLLLYLKPGLKNPPIFAPSIRYVRVNEYEDKLVLTGEFGEQVPKVTVGGTPLQIDSNSASEIVALLPLPPKAGSSGDVVVEVRGVKSNARQLSRWDLAVQYTWDEAIDVPEFILLGGGPLIFRADLGRYRTVPHEQPRWPSLLGGPPTRNSFLRLEAHGTHVDPDCSRNPAPCDPCSILNGSLMTLVTVWLNLADMRIPARPIQGGPEISARSHS